MATRALRRLFTLAAGAALIVGVAGPAAAQSAAGGQAQQGPLVLQPITSGLVVAPDLKITTIDHDSDALFGVYGGWATGNQILFGAGVYTLMNGTRDRGITYGGAVVGWTSGDDGPIGIGVRGLVGGGSATLVTGPVMVAPPPGERTNSHGPSGPLYTYVLAHDTFLVAEPEVDLSLRAGPHVRLLLGGSYRFTGRTTFSSNELDGAAGNISLQIKFGG